MLDWVITEIKRANRNLLLVNMGLLLLVAALVAGNWRYCANFVTGCRAIDSEHLATVQSPDQLFHNFVTVSGTKAVNTGYRDVERKVDKASGRVISSEVKDEYLLLKIGDKALLVKAPPGADGTNFSGELEPTTERVTIDLLVPLRKSNPEVAGMVLPFTLNAADYRSSGWVGLAFGLPVFALACWNVLKFLRRRAEPRIAPLWRQLSSYGNVQQLSMQINTELQGPTLQFGDVRLTQSWLLKKGTFSTWISPVNDLVWVYKKVTKHSVNFIPTGKTYGLILVGGHRQRLEASMREKHVDGLLGELTKRVPWCVFGFSPQLDTLWKKDPTAIIGEVATRRQQRMNPAAATAGA